MIYEIQTESGHEAVTVCQEGRGPIGGEGRLGERAAAGWLVVMRIVEVDTDGPLGGRCPDTGPAPLDCSIGEGDAQIILNTTQRYYTNLGTFTTSITLKGLTRLHLAKVWTCQKGGIIFE